MRNLLSLFLFAIVILGCSSSQNIISFDKTVSSIDEQFHDSLFEHAHWGVLIKSLTSGEIWYELNSDKMFMPASNEKILTTAAALITLGENFRFSSQLYYSGEIIDSVLKGNLIVKGNGDPTFYTRFFDDPRDPFFSWADSLKNRGIKRIDGNIIGDDNAFDDYGFGAGWSFDGLANWYSAESGALQFNENYIDLQIIPPENLNDSLQIIPNVKSDYFEIINKIKIVDSGRTRVRIQKPFGTNQITLIGRIRPGSDTLEISPSIYNPTKFYISALKETLEEKGIEVLGKALDCDDIDNWDISGIDTHLFLTHYSPPLSEILRVLMKRSQNMYAETMVKTLGWEKSGIGSFREGKKVVESVLSAFGIKRKTYSYADGSGLSRYNFISPKQIVLILEKMRNSRHWETWRNIFPIAGVDGTLRKRMKNTSAEGNVIAKTGTISNVRALSGYLTTADGEEIVFSFLINGHLRSSKDTEKITDSVLSIIADYPYSATSLP